MAQKSKKSLQNRIFIQTLSALSPADLKTFKTFCNQSPSISEKTKNLLIIICRTAPDFQKLTEDKVLSSFFPDNPKAKSQLNYALHDLFELLQKWLIQKELESDNYLQNQLFIRACKKRFLHQQFFKRTSHTLDVLNSDSLKVPDTWHKQFETNFNLFYHVHTPKNQEEVESLTEMEANLEMFYYGSKIRLLSQNINRRKTYPHLPEIAEEEIERTLEFARKQKSQFPFFALYLQLIEYLLSPNKLALNEFIQNYKKDRTQLERLDQSLLLAIVAYSLNDPTMKGDQSILDIQYELLKYAFDHDLVLFDNEMADTPFNNFLVVACMRKEFVTAQKKLKKYEPHFHPDIRQEFTNLMQSTIFYHQGKYDKVKLSLYQYPFKKPKFRIRSRNLLLKSLYERFQKDKTLKAPILSELKNFRKYVQKQNGIPVPRKNMYYSMINVIRKLTHARHNRPSNRTKAKWALMDFLNDKTNKPISRNWLLEKVEEL